MYGFDDSKNKVETYSRHESDVLNCTNAGATTASCIVESGTSNHTTVLDPMGIGIDEEILQLTTDQLKDRIKWSVVFESDSADVYVSSVALTNYVVNGQIYTKLAYTVHNDTQTSHTVNVRATAGLTNVTA